MRPLCIYHGNCADGFGAAWVVRRFFGAGNVDFHAGIYQDAPPDVAGREVIITDFSYKRPVLEQMAKVRTEPAAIPMTDLYLHIGSCFLCVTSRYTGKAARDRGEELLQLVRPYLREGVESSVEIQEPSRYAGLRPIAVADANDLVEIIGTDGDVHYRRPFGDPMIEQALRTPGYSVRGARHGDQTKRQRDPRATALMMHLGSGGKPISEIQALEIVELLDDYPAGFTPEAATRLINALAHAGGDS
jgi:hypothetical protein